MADQLWNDWQTEFKGYDISADQVTALRTGIHDSTAVTTSAERLAAYPEAATTPLDMQQRIGGLWMLLIETAVRYPSTQPHIVLILLVLRKRPAVEEPKGEGEEFINLDDGRIWSEMTDWASTWADAFNGYGAQFLIEASSDPHHAAKHAAWTQACAFAARLDATGDDALASYGAGLDRATRAISDALESEQHSEHEPGSLAAAAHIFQLDSRRIYQRCRAKQSKGMLDGRGNSLWKGDAGYSVARWMLWEERWTTFQRSTNYSAQAREMAEKALSGMKQAEEEHVAERA